MKKILIVFGTRPEIIKLAPLIHELKDVTDLTTLHTGQHKELAEPLFKLFNFVPDIDLKIMKESQDLFDLTTKLLPRLRAAMIDVKPDYVIVQGDTTSSYLAALSAFYLQIPVMHVEAGLRSHSIHEPFPEEFNRRQISGIASVHFAATQLNKQNLMREGVNENRILVTGNTVVDALYSILNLSQHNEEAINKLIDQTSKGRTALITVHRRENHGKPFRNILKAVEQLLELYTDLKILMPVHPNPNVQNTISEYGLNNSRFITIPPVRYDQFIKLIQHTGFILTDSGGLQEESAALGKKVFVLRHKTERQELLESGLGELTGTDTEQIVNRVTKFLNSDRKTNKNRIYGDGTAAQKIRDFILDQL